MKQHTAHILIADPDPSQRKELSRSLEKAGYAVRMALTGGDLIEQCEVDPPTVVIMDIRMPDMDGFDVCECVRYETCESDITIVVVSEPTEATSHADLGKMVEYAGGDFFFAKPFDPMVVVDLLNDLGLNRRPFDLARPRPVTFPTHVVWPTSRRRASMIRS